MLCRRLILAILLLMTTSLVAAQNLFCSEAPHWKVSSVTQTPSDSELVLAIETVDAEGAVQLMMVSTTSGSTRYVTTQSSSGWTFAVHVQKEEQRRTARVGTQAWCDGRMRAYDEIVLLVLATLDRT